MTHESQTRRQIERNIMAAYFEYPELDMRGIAKVSGTDLNTVRAIIIPKGLPVHGNKYWSRRVLNGGTPPTYPPRNYGIIVDDDRLNAVLDRHAAKRGIGRGQLLREIVAEALGSDLVDAVLDDGVRS